MREVAIGKVGPGIGNPLANSLFPIPTPRKHPRRIGGDLPVLVDRLAPISPVIPLQAPRGLLYDREITYICPRKGSVWGLSPAGPFALRSSNKTRP